MSTEQTSSKVLCVLSDEQRLEYEHELEQLQGAGVPFEFTDEPDGALDRIGEMQPCMVMVGMDLGEMEGLEFVALMMNRYKTYEGKVLVLPAKDDPFPPVVQQRNVATGKSSTDQIDASKIAEVVLEATLGGAATPDAPAAAPAEPSAAPAAVPAPAAAPAGPSAAAVATAPEPEALPAPPPAPSPEMAPRPSGPAPVPAPAARASGRPSWWLPAGAVAVLAVLAILFFVLRSGGTESKPSADRTNTGDQKVKPDRGTADTHAAQGGDQAGGDQAGGDQAGGDQAGGDQAGGDQAGGDQTTKPAALTHPELREYATLPLEFPRGGSDFTVSDEAALEQTVSQFAEVVKKDAAVWVEIGGHTSIDGAPEANYDLGKRRANKVRRLLAKHGIPKARTIVKNYGAAMPIASNDDTDGRQKNRRVTLRLVD